MPAKLPFPSASVDGVVLHHALETEHDRRSTLREAARVLRPGGRLLLLGVNPSSLWLLAKPFAVFRRLKPVAVPRLKDWLAVLGLEQDAKTRYLNYRSVLPLALRGKACEQASGWLNRLQAPIGGVYLIAATKVAPGYVSERRPDGQRSRRRAPVRAAQSRHQTAGAGMSDVEIFTDGACRGNPGPGGWAALLRYPGGERGGTGDAERCIRGCEASTTNNRMELTAAIEGLQALAQPSRVSLTTDSQYVRLGITRWIKDWKRRGWKRSDKRPVLNRDLWQRLDALNERHEVVWHWVKGHSGHAENDAVDRAANLAIDQMLADEGAVR